MSNHQRKIEINLNILYLYDRQMWRRQFRENEQKLRCYLHSSVRIKHLMLLSVEFP